MLRADVLERRGRDARQTEDSKKDLSARVLPMAGQEGAWQVREVYAHAGRALLWSQGLEWSIVNCLVGNYMFTHRPEVAVSKAQLERLREQLEEYEEKNFKKTLGKMLESLRSSGIEVSEELDCQLRNCLAIRNRLAHRYFRERVVEFRNPAGRELMLRELKEMASQLKRCHAEMERLATAINTKLGISPAETARWANNLWKAASDGVLKTEHVRKPR
jgi:hypothetical protein